MPVTIQTIQNLNLLLFGKTNMGTKGMKRCPEVYNKYSIEPQQMAVSLDNLMLLG